MLISSDSNCDKNPFATDLSFLPGIDSSLSGSRFNIDVPSISFTFALYVDISTSTESLKPSSSVSIPPSLESRAEISSTAFCTTGNFVGESFTLWINSFCRAISFSTSNSEVSRRNNELLIFASIVANSSFCGIWKWCIYSIKSSNWPSFIGPPPSRPHAGIGELARP